MVRSTSKRYVLLNGLVYLWIPPHALPRIPPAGRDFAVAQRGRRCLRIFIPHTPILWGLKTSPKSLTLNQPVCARLEKVQQCTMLTNNTLTKYN